MASEKSSSTDINALAAEVMDLWQEHLTLYAADPKAKDDLMRMLEPQRQLFADWAAMMQNTPYGASAAKTSTGDGHHSASTSHGTTSASAAPDDGALRLAQLAYRMAELEKRLAKLESAAPQPAKTPRRRQTH